MKEVAVRQALLLYPPPVPTVISEWVQWVQIKVITTLQALLCTHSESSIDLVFEEFGAGLDPIWLPSLEPSGVRAW